MINKTPLIVPPTIGPTRKPADPLELDWAPAPVVVDEEVADVDVAPAGTIRK